MTRTEFQNGIFFWYESMGVDQNVQLVLWSKSLISNSMGLRFQSDIAWVEQCWFGINYHKNPSVRRVWYGLVPPAKSLNSDTSCRAGAHSFDSYAIFPNIVHPALTSRFLIRRHMVPSGLWRVASMHIISNSFRPPSTQSTFQASAQRWTRAARRWTRSSPQIFFGKPRDQKMVLQGMVGVERYPLVI